MCIIVNIHYITFHINITSYNHYTTLPLRIVLILTLILLSCKTDNKILVSLISIEPEKVYALPDASLADDEYKFMSTFSDLADRELVATIGWAKQVPG